MIHSHLQLYPKTTNGILESCNFATNALFKNATF